MSSRKYPPVSIHPTLHGKLEVNWKQEYSDEFKCPCCQTGQLTNPYYRESQPCKLGLGCNSCRKITSLTCKLPGVGLKHSPISEHQTLNKRIEINWKQEYSDEFKCPCCQTGQLTNPYYRESQPCKLGLGCNSCRKITSLTCKLPGVGLKHSPISEHQTLNGTLKIDWHQKYQGEYDCPVCNQGQLNKHFYHPNSMGNLALACNSCNVYTYLTCHVPVHISRYLPNVECPNPLCTDIGHNKQKGWVYKLVGKRKDCKCQFCNITFNPKSIHSASWIGSQSKKELSAFSFNADVWELQHFYDQLDSRILNFQSINPIWFRQKAKEYLHFMLKSKVFASDSRVRERIIVLR